MVSIWSIIFMALSLFISLALTFGLFLFLRKRLGLKVVPAVTGAAAFIVFVLILERLLHMVVLKTEPDGSIALLKNPLLYVLYGTLAAGVFEETARFLCFKLLKRKYEGFGTAISYGIGHGGIEVLLLVTLSMISNIIMSIMINTGITNVPGNAPGIDEAIRQLTSTAPWLFSVAGFERIFAVAVQISLSVIVWHSVYTKGKVWLYPLAIGLHALVDVAPAMYQCGMIKSIVLVEAVLVLIASVLVLSTIWMHKKLLAIPQNPD